MNQIKAETVTISPSRIVYIFVRDASTKGLRSAALAATFSMELVIKRLSCARASREIILGIGLDCSDYHSVRGLDST